jgi:ribonuclease P protein subunit POP4
MMLRPESIARHELIGLEVMVNSSTNHCLEGLSGRVVDESRNILLLETKRGLKRVPKGGTSLIFTLPAGQKVWVDGSILISRPENRINKRMPKTRWKL